MSLRRVLAPAGRQWRQAVSQAVSLVKIVATRRYMSTPLEETTKTGSYVWSIIADTFGRTAAEKSAAVGVV